MSSGRGAIFRLILAVCAGATLLPSPALAATRETPLEARLKAHIDTLASDEFEGREPGTPGHEWFAPVTLVAREPSTSSALFSRKGRRQYVPKAAVLMLTSGSRSLVREAPVLFVGNGQGLVPDRSQLAGRVALLLDAGSTDSTRQNALLAAGASAVLTILDGNRSLENVAARRQRSGYALADDSIGGDLEGFITREGMERLLQGSGRTLQDMEKAAESKSFAPEVLDITASLEAATRETAIRTYNLIGKLPGRRRDAGAVLLVAHWDAFGICAEPPAEDLICNGAIDNASGLAALTEIARILARGPRLERDVYFLATTSEELGLLGAHAFAENPPLPLNQIVAAFNIDSVALAPRGGPLVIVGKGMTKLDPQIAAVAKREKRKIVEGEAANEYVKRQDGWALLQHDIPTVMVTSAYADLGRIEAFFEGDYHRPSDDLKRPIELGGAAEDVLFHAALARWFADPRRVPGPPAK